VTGMCSVWDGMWGGAHVPDVWDVAGGWGRWEIDLAPIKAYEKKIALLREQMKESAQRKVLPPPLYPAPETSMGS
jgi:hypothetical protein